MDGMTQVALPVLGIVAAAAVTFYVVSFSELREVRYLYLFSLAASFIRLDSCLICSVSVQKSFRDLEDSEFENGGFDSSLSSSKRRARRKAE